MDLDEARTSKAELEDWVTDLLTSRPVPQSAASAPPLALGLHPRCDGGFDLALRYQLGTPTARMVARRARAEVGPRLDVRHTGRIRPLGGTGPVRPVPTARAEGDTGRERPLRPGLSVAHHALTAGTLGAFVVPRGGGPLLALSAAHVLVPAARFAAPGGRGRDGDLVVQPGPSDRGRAPTDVIGRLDRYIAVRAANGEGGLDAALAALDSAAIGGPTPVDAAYPDGPVTRVAGALGGETVAKVGRTTGVTRGRVSVIELDDLVIDYGEDVGDVRFQGQTEVESLDGTPFSAPGDSGALVYTVPDERMAEGADADAPAAIGLLYAGTAPDTSGAPGLSYLHPIGRVLDEFGVDLAG